MARHLQYLPAAIRPSRKKNGTPHSNNRHHMYKPRACSIRKIGWALLGLVVLVIAAAHIPSSYSLPTPLDNSAAAAHIAKESQAANDSFKTGWRYTKNGWQNRREWHHPLPVRTPALHPAVVGSLQLLISLAALIGFSTGKKQLAKGLCDESCTII